ncbi:hypothetical protein EDD86DRAFT_250251 [Gorgonomyces haynaldii]|nr:hypothetical protein EDD86DRAFT_250251 [Gorgonomyces haynaldii]
MEGEFKDLRTQLGELRKIEKQENKLERATEMLENATTQFEIEKWETLANVAIDYLNRLRQRQDTPGTEAIICAILPQPKDGVDDIRTGLLMSPTLHKQFYGYLFTIECKSDKYYIKAGVHKDVQKRKGKELHFGGDKELRPNPKFLAYHNAKFEILNTQWAARYRRDRQNADFTRVAWTPRDDGVDSDLKVRSWIEGMISEPSSDAL